MRIDRQLKGFWSDDIRWYPTSRESVSEHWQWKQHKKQGKQQASCIVSITVIRIMASSGLLTFRQRLHEIESIWNRYEIGSDKPCVYMGLGGSGTDRIYYLVPNDSTHEGDPVWNRTVPVSNRSRVNRMDPYHSGSDPKWIWTYLIRCKRSLRHVEMFWRKKEKLETRSKAWQQLSDPISTEFSWYLSDVSNSLA